MLNHLLKKKKKLGFTYKSVTNKIELHSMIYIYGCIVCEEEVGLPADPTRITLFKASIEDINRVHTTPLALRAQNFTWGFHHKH